LHALCAGGVDFGALGCLIHEGVKNSEPFPTLARCADLFDACQFKEFWSIYSTIADAASHLPKVVAFAKSKHAQNQIRSYILDTLSLTYKSVSIDDVVLTSLNLESKADFEEFLENGKAAGIVEKIVDEKVIFVSRSENTKRNKVFQEGVAYSTIRRMVEESKE